MIIKGASRSNGGQLSRYLSNAAANDQVSVIELPGLADDLHDAVRDMERVAAITNGRKPLYHAQINPEPGYEMSADQWQRSVDVLAEKLGFDEQPRAVVLHEKDGRTHAHVVFQRTDIERGVLLSDSFTRYKHMEASRQLERELGHRRTPEKKRERVYTQEEARKAANDRKTPRKVKREVTQIYQGASDPEDFRQQLQKRGYDIATGNRRAYALLDKYGQDYNLARMVKGARTSELKGFLAPVQDQLETQDVYQSMIKEYRDLQVAKKMNAIDEAQADQRSRLHQRRKKDLELADGMDQKQEVMAYYAERSKRLREKQAEERRRWQEMERYEQIRQLEEERIRREMERQREQDLGRSRGLSL
jgi:hypothetical protein